jgi:hypothetical protein
LNEEEKAMESFEVDRGIRAFLNYATDDLIARVRRQVFNDFDYELGKCVPRPLATDATGPQLAEYLHECRKVVEDLISERSSGYSACRWLFYLRRLPNQSFPSYQGGLDPYKIALSEAITGRIARALNDPDPLDYPLHEPVLNRVLRFSQEILYLVNLHAALHQVAKDVPFRFERSAIPIPRPSSATSKALWLFDWRVGSFDQKPLARLGTEVHGAASTDRVSNVFALVPRREKTEWVRTPESPHDQMDPPQIVANYGIQVFDFAELGQLISDRRIDSPLYSDEAGALLVILRIAAEMFSDPSFSRPLLEVGYIPMNKTTFFDVVSPLFDDAEHAVHSTIPNLRVPNSKETLLRELEEMRGSPWPILPGPVVRSCREIIYLDLASATMRLNQAFEFPRVAGAQANARAEHFETSVQSVVDRSRWADSRTRPLQGRTLRYQGKPLTDIDAIGSREDKLLLISCKSVLYAEYDTADYRVLRNAADVVQRAVVTWNEVCSFLRDKRVGDNYDFSEYHDIVGVICTPVVVYVPLGLATARVAEGLLAAVSISELRVWLDGIRLESGD